MKTIFIFYSLAKLPKTDKSSEYQDFKFLIQNKRIIKTLVAIMTSLFFIIAIVTVIIIELNSTPADDFYDIPPTSHASNLQTHQVLTKTDWLGKPAKSFQNITTPVELVIIKHTGGGTCQNFQKCAGKVQTIQGANIADGMPDIYCNFLIGGDGNIYVGRGWDVRNQQRDSTIDIVYMGNFDIDIFTENMAKAGLLLLKDGLKNNKLPQNYKIVCHNQTQSQRSPGVNIIKEVVKWPRYDNRSYFSQSLVSRNCCYN